ncbi:flagellar hook-associated protein FlgK [Tropicimonas marinistellae]|uniref:flagellar hook-associated protein FlgK n=1 Tax=Tropicimonas marinistellae TaxID=1739787 RepID=UPI00082E10F5|nr:flagellar hook-associated protein FlgK [Tropicimonas marinistellae]
MTFSTALSNALSGLTAVSRAAEVVSNNVANAMTEGYARREISLSSRSVGGVGSGVQVDGVVRVTDERTTADRRHAEASMENASAEASAWLRIENAVGLPTEEGSLEHYVNALETALIDAASRPDQDVRLTSAISAASELVDHIRSTSDELQEMRTDAESDIASMVDQLNSSLKQVETLNWQIFEMTNSGQDASGLLDQRQNVIDSISEIVPVNQVARDGGQVALYTSGGAIILDGPAGEFEFSQTGIITPHMSLEGGALSGLTLNGNTLNIGSSYDPIGGGKLAAAFEIRDEIAPTAQEELDSVARDLVERFQDTSLDTTLATGDAGLFTDGGSTFDTADEAGLSARIEINTTVDPDVGGESWRLRDGLQAATEGDVGDASLLTALAERLNEERVVASGMSAGQERTVAELASDLVSKISSQQQAAEDRQTYESARVDALKTEEARTGVDTDDEMQKLLLIENAYAANARVIQTLDELMDQLLGI